MSTESAGTLDIAEIEAKRAVLVARKDALQLALTEAKNKKRWARRAAILEELREAEGDLRVVNAILKEHRSAQYAELAAVEFLGTSTIEAARDLKESVRLVLGYVGDVNDLLRRWRDVPPATVATCVSELAIALGVEE